MAARPGPPLGVGGRGTPRPEPRVGVGARSFHRWRARAPALVASLGRAGPARLRSSLCSRMGWGSWEERAGARAGCALPLPDLAPAIRAQRAVRRSADATRSRGPAGTYASRFGGGEGREFSATHLPSLGCSDHPLLVPRSARLPPWAPWRGEVLGLHPNPHWIGDWERSGTPSSKQ